MIVKLKANISPEQIAHFHAWAKEHNLEVHGITGNRDTLLGLVGDTAHIPLDQIQSLEVVADVKRIQEPYKSANRKFHPEDSCYTIGNTKIGAGHFALIAGPCSVETEDQIIEVARAVKAAGATMLRGGAFKPRTSPYAFQGLREQGIHMLVKAKKETGLPIVTEIMDISQLTVFDEVDVIQVGARNTQNFELLKELGKLHKPILLKRGISGTLEELLMSAEYIMAGGNNQVILCERGIRTFEHATRNTMDISAIPLLKRLSHLPVIADPSHATGQASLVPAMALASVAAGADGLIIEIHNNPSKALCDGPQSLTPEDFLPLKKKIDAVRYAISSSDQ